ncbi:MAG: hypothetical protein GYA66_08950 [Phyllobacteriaceae bacterium]|nr:hypothetical protein [Phyllobacteriaceae bacterium]
MTRDAAIQIIRVKVCFVDIVGIFKAEREFPLWVRLGHSLMGSIGQHRAKSRSWRGKILRLQYFNLPKPRHDLLGTWGRPNYCFLWIVVPIHHGRNCEYLPVRHLRWRVFFHGSNLADTPQALNWQRRELLCTAPPRIVCKPT